MDIYEFAMQMEKDGENYYRDLTKQTTSAGLKKIFTLLADEEAKHALFVEQLRGKSDARPVVESQVLTNVKNIFTEMKSEPGGPQKADSDAVSAFKKACDIEKASKTFYLQKAAEAKSEQAETLFRRLAKEEDKHLHIMENIVEFVSRPEPGQWLENAEWHHLDEY